MKVNQEEANKKDNWGGETAQQPVTYSGYLLKFKR